MSRPSKLDVVLRLARRDADRAIRGLAEARAATSQIELQIEQLRARANACAHEKLAALSMRLDAGNLRIREQNLENIERLGALARRKLPGLQDLEARHRANVARAKLRVRALENAIGQRMERERLLDRRAAQRRLDEREITRRLAMEDPRDVA